MIRNVLGAALAIAALLPATTADAAPKPRRPAPCVDPAHDVRLTRNGPLVEAPHLDLRGADLAVSRSVVAVVIRVTDLTEDTGVWKVTWQSGKQRYYAVAATGPAAHPLDPDSAPGFRGGVVDGAAAGVVGRLDPVRNEIRINLRRPDLRGLGAVSGLAVQARRTLGNPDLALVDFLDC